MTSRQSRVAEALVFTIQEEILFNNVYQYYKKRNKLLSVSKLGIFLRSIGFNPSEKELEGIIKTLEGKTELQYQELEPIIKRMLVRLNTQEEIVNAFRIFDDDVSGQISGTHLRSILTSIGEKLTQEDVDEMLALVPNQDPDNPYLNYEEIVPIICKDLQILEVPYNFEEEEEEVYKQEYGNEEEEEQDRT